MISVVFSALFAQNHKCYSKQVTNEHFDIFGRRQVLVSCFTNFSKILLYVGLDRKVSLKYFNRFLVWETLAGFPFVNHKSLEIFSTISLINFWGRISWIKSLHCHLENTIFILFTTLSSVGLNREEKEKNKCLSEVKKYNFQDYRRKGDGYWSIIWGNDFLFQNSISFSFHLLFDMTGKVFR